MPAATRSVSGESQHRKMWVVLLVLLGVWVGSVYAFRDSLVAFFQGSQRRSSSTVRQSAPLTPVTEFNPRVVIPKAFPPISDAPVVAAESLPRDDPDDGLLDNELILGVEIAGEARAYPINMLTGPSREIINDRLGGAAIAATW